jgi:tetratricopeptide (TPR) repeat protein
MKTTATYKAGLEKLDSLWKRGHFDKALLLVDRLLSKWPDNPDLLVKKGQLIQMQEGEDGPSLEEAKAILERAVDLDEESAQPCIELAFFCYAVEDDAAAAVHCFSKAEGLLVDMLKECRKGKKAALAELSESGETNGTLPRAKDRRRGSRIVKLS